MITALGIGLFLENFTLGLLGPEPRNFPNLIQMAPWEIAGLTITPRQVLIILLAAALMIALDLLVRRTLLGMAMRAISDFSLQVEEGELVGLIYPNGDGLFDALRRSAAYREEEQRLTRRAGELLERFQLSHYADTPARNLPYGEQRRCEMARALISGPRLLLLDEPAAGVNQSAAEHLIRIIRELKDEFRLTIILIEPQMRVVLNLCQRVTVLDFGCTIASGPTQEIPHSPAVLGAYLGRVGSLAEGESDSAAPS